MSELLARVVAGLGELSLALAATIVAAALLDLALRRAPWPELRAVPWLLVLARGALPPGFASPLALLDFGGAATTASTAAAAASAAGNGAAPAPPAGDLVRDGALVGLWLAGALLLAVGAARRHRAVRSQLLSRALPELPAEWSEAVRAARSRLALRRLPRIVAVPGIAQAMVLGALRPVVLLPARLPGADPARRLHVVLHELAHVKRRDPLVGALSAALQVVFWFHPLLWWARRRLTLAVELCADAEVARALGGDAAGYRRTLLAAAGRANGVLPAGALGFLARRSAILERLRALERPGSGPRGLRRATAALLALALAATVLPSRGSSVGAAAHRADRGPSAAPVPDAERIAAAHLAPDLPGCLLDRYTVLGALAAAEGPPAAAPARSPGSIAR